MIFLSNERFIRLQGKYHSTLRNARLQFMGGVMGERRPMPLCLLQIFESLSKNSCPGIITLHQRTPLKVLA